MPELHILGPAEIRNADGSLNNTFLAGPKRLAVLAYLLLDRPRGFHRRDSLLPVFWPDLGQKSARNALSNMLYHIRRTLGDDVIVNRGNEEILINTDSFYADVIEFDTCLEQGNFEAALQLYRGTLLHGFHISDASSEFDQWLEQQRARYQEHAADCAWKLIRKAEQEEDSEKILEAIPKLVSPKAICEHTHLELITLLNRMGLRKAALDLYHDFSKQLMHEYGQEVSSELEVLVREIRQKGGRKGKAKEHLSSLKGSGSASGKRIAVLPFDTLGEAASMAFTDAMHGDILTNLSGVANLHVISRTSVKKYAGSRKTAGEIASELNVSYILEGEVLDTGNELQVNVRLVDAEQEVQLWSKDFRKELTAQNLFAIQSKITRQIASAIHIELTPKEQQRIDHAYTDEIGAYRLYMQGWSWIERRTKKGIRRGLDYFKEASREDPDFTLAKVGQAYALLGLLGYGHEKAELVLPAAEKLINEALREDPALAEAHTALGLYHNTRQEGPEAIAALLHSVRLRPGYANAHNKLSWQYQSLGDSIRALASAMTATDLDPFSPEAVINLAFSYLINGKLEDSLREAKRTLQLQPEWPTASFYLGLVLYHLNRMEEARQYVKDIQVPWTGEGPRAVLALIEIAIQNKEAAEKHLAFFRKNKDFFHIGLILAALGRTGEALRMFKNHQRWEPWATHAMHFLFASELKGVKASPDYEVVHEKLISDWGGRISASLVY